MRVDDLQRQLEKAQAENVVLRHELEQKRLGFSLLAGLTDAIGTDTEDDAFFAATNHLNEAMNMERTVVLMPEEEQPGRFWATEPQGYSAEQAAALSSSFLDLPDAMLDLTGVVVNGESRVEALEEVGAYLSMPYFIAVPVVVLGNVEAVLVTGRLREEPPFMTRLDAADLETLHAIAAFLSAILTRQYLAESEHRANHDALTGLPNPRLGKDRLTQAIAFARREKEMVALLFIDLDGFKAVNDTLGHEAGDMVLKEVSARLLDGVREVDTVARLGGDEFIIVLAGDHDRQGAARVAAQVVEAIAAPMACINGKLPIGGSVGIALYPEHADTANELLRLADEAMYDMKRGGKNGFVFASG